MDRLTMNAPANHHNVASASGIRRRTPVNPDSTELERRIVLYFRAVGLGEVAEPSDFAAGIVEKAKAKAVNGSAEELQSLAIDAAIDAVDQWVNRVIVACGFEPDDSEARGHVLWHLPAVLKEHAAAIRWGDAPTPELCALIEASVTPMLPDPSPGEMRPQAFGDVPPPLRAGFWRRVWRRLRRGWHSMTRTLSGR
jgi:hypothetical protein